MGIKMLIREYYEKLYGYTFDDIDEMDQFLKRHHYQNSHKEKNINYSDTVMMAIYNAMKLLKFIVA